MSETQELAAKAHIANNTIKIARDLIGIDFHSNIDSGCCVEIINDCLKVLSIIAKQLKEEK